MALIIVLNGTTGATDGTPNDESHPFVATAIDTAIDAHIREESDKYRADATFSMPSEWQVSFDGGTNWYGIADAPKAYGADIPDTNTAIKLRQHAVAATTAGTFTTAGTTSDCTALTAISDLAASTAIGQSILTWTDAANESSYLIEYCAKASDPGSGSWSGETGYTSTTAAAGASTKTITGLTTGTKYWFRIKALGVGRYSDSAWSNNATATPSATWTSVLDDSLASAGSWNKQSYVTIDGTARVSTAFGGEAHAWLSLQNYGGSFNMATEKRKLVARVKTRTTSGRADFFGSGRVAFTTASAGSSASNTYSLARGLSLDIDNNTYHEFDPLNVTGASTLLNNSMVSDRWYDVEIITDGAGNCELAVTDTTTSTRTSTSGTITGTANNIQLYFANVDGATVDQSFQVDFVKLYTWG